MSYDKKYERKVLEWHDEFDDKTLGEMRHIINALTDKFGESAILRYEWEWDTVGFWIDIEKRETPEEKAEREVKELAKKQKKEAADRAKFEKLKSEYGW